jgi:WD40 repeat protein
MDSNHRFRQTQALAQGGDRRAAVLLHGGQSPRLAALADGRLASDGEIRLWPKEGTSEPMVLPRGSPITSLAAPADGRLASGGYDGKIKLWPKEGVGEPVVLSHGSSVLSLVVLTDGRLASGGQTATSSSGPRTAEASQWCARREAR